MKEKAMFAYIGKWQDGTIGWNMPRYLHKSQTIKRPAHPKVEDNPVALSSEYYLCKVTIDIVKEKPQGKRLVRKGKSFK